MRNFKSLILIVFSLSTSVAFSQSESFEALKDHFADDKDVYSFKVSGFLCRTVLWAAGEWEFKDAIKDVKNVRVITIPRENFKQKDLTVGGFRKLIRADHFESLINIKDKGDNVEIYIQQSGNRNDRYLVLVEEPRDITVIELKGTIDLQKLKDMDQKLSYQSH